MLLGLLWLLEGTNGVRHMMIVGAPMLAFGFIRLIKALNAWGWKKALLRTDAFRLCLILLGSCLCLLCCLCLVFSGAYTALFMRTKDQTMDRWSGMSYSDMDTAQAAQECADFMLAEGYTHALIEYWYASTVMEAGNGRLAVAPLSLSYATDSDQQSRVSIYAWGTDTSPFLPENLPEELVVFVEWEEDLPTFLDRFPDAELVWESSPFSACVIPKDMLTQP